MPVPDQPENSSRCLCPTCPTYDDCMSGNGERMFCSRGQSPCEPRSQGCICGECPVWSDYDLSSYYFCLEGAAQ